MAEALGHLRILDLSRVLAGPWATQIFADLGAEVLKVERPLTGDDTRAWGPPFLEDADGISTGDSGYFLSANRGKKSITVDLATRQGQGIIRQLALSSDILIENYKVGTLKRYGLSYEDLKAENPRLIYCSITGFGQTGPYADLPGYDLVFQGMSGIMSLTGQPDGAPGGEPMKFGLPISDLIAGIYASTACLAALEQRHKTGLGQHIDIALMDCSVAITSYQAINYQLADQIPKRLGNAHSNMVPYQVFSCLDGDIVVAVGNDRQFSDFAALIGRPDLSRDPEFETVAQRNRNRTQLIPIIADIMKARPRGEWIARMQATDVPCGPINSIAQMLIDPQVQHREMAQNLKHASGAEAPGIASPIRMSGSPFVAKRGAPSLGEHTGEILRNVLGLGESQIDELTASKAI